jgi:hypothetical protein
VTVAAPKRATVGTIDELLTQAVLARDKAPAEVRPDRWWSHVDKLLDRRNELTKG